MIHIIEGISHPPARMVIFGPPGVGKSSFACSFGPGKKARPEVLALDYEQGLSEIGPRRVRGEDTWEKSLALIQEACISEGSWKTVVIDTIDRLEDLASAHVCRVGVKGRSVSDLEEFGYGGGYEKLLERWRELLFILESARTKGREVILVAHVQRKTEDDPQLGSYSKWIAALQKKTWGATHRWADAMLFAQHEQGIHEGRAVMTGKRVLRTEAGSGYEAKNRWGLPQTLPLSWEAFAAARAAYQRTPDEVAQAIRALCSTQELKEKAEAYIKDAADGVPRLCEVEAALRTKVAGNSQPQPKASTP